MPDKPINPLLEIFDESEIRTLSPEEQTEFQVKLSDYMGEVHREYIRMEHESLKKASDIVLNI